MRLNAAAVATTDIVSFETHWRFRKFKCTATVATNLLIVGD
jgi:hypothetical protein